MAKAKKKTKTKSKSKPKATAKGSVKAKASAKPATKAKAKAKAKPKPKPKPAAKTKPTAKPEATANGGANPADVKRLVIEMFREFYPVEETDDEVLQIDPNGYDLDPSPFYETLQARFGVPYDDNAFYFGGYGGKLEATIAFLAARWDGTLHETAQEMLED